MLFEMVFLDLSLQGLTELAFTRDHEARVGHARDDDRRRLDQVALPLVRHKRGDVADDGRVMGEPQLRMEVRGRRGLHVPEVDPLVDGDGAGRRHTVGDHHLADRLGCADEAVDLPVLPA